MPEVQEQPLQELRITSPQHTRVIKRGKNRGKKYTVKRHTKTFRNYMMPVKVGENEYRTINSQYKTQGKHFLGNAIELILNETLSVTKGLEGKIQAKIIAKD